MILTIVAIATHKPQLFILIVIELAIEAVLVITYGVGMFLLELGGQ